MKVLIIGASSYVGARLFLDLSKKFDVIGTYHMKKLSEKFISLDVTNSEEIKKTIVEYSPEIIIHVASNASTAWCEANPELAISLNQESTRRITESANNIGAKVFLISSFHSADSKTVYGRTKLQSENYVKKTNKGFIIIRPSVIIGFSPNTFNNRPFNRILKNLDDKTEAIYDTSWKFQPTYIGHISEVIIQLIERNIINEIIPVAVLELKTRFDIANDILKAFNIEVKPIDHKDNTLVVKNNLEKLSDFRLPQYSYSEIVDKIIDEIKHRERFSKI